MCECGAARNNPVNREVVWIVMTKAGLSLPATALLHSQLCLKCWGDKGEGNAVTMKPGGFTTAK